MIMNCRSLTADWVLKQFDINNINYAILRNYEELPHVGNDLDFVCSDNDLASIRNILQEARSLFCWDYVTESSIWDSYVKDFSIKVFKLISFDQGLILQLDFFGGYSIWSAPVIDLESFLKYRTRLDFFYKISNNHEILIRGMQLACAIRDNEVDRSIKIEGVIDRLGGKEELVKSFQTISKVDINADVVNFSKKEFSNWFNKFKRRFFLNFLFRHPIRALLRFIERIRFRIKLSTYATPGIILFINHNSFYKNLERITQDLEKLKKNNIINGFSTCLKSSQLLTQYKFLRKEHFILLPCRFSNKKYNKDLLQNAILVKFNR